MNGWYCSQHTFRHGFCACCGQFWGGIESFDFGNSLCEHCKDQLDADADMDGDDDSADHYEEYIP